MRTLELIGGCLCRILGALGLRGVHDGAYYGSSLALGTVDTSLWELVNAYRTLANGGAYSGRHLLPRGPSSRQRVFSAPACFFGGGHSVRPRSPQPFLWVGKSFGDQILVCGQRAGTNGDACATTGAWGFRPAIQVGVWVRQFFGQPMWDVSGVTGAAPVWREIMNIVHRDDPGTIAGRKVS